MHAVFKFGRSQNIQSVDHTCSKHRFGHFNEFEKVLRTVEALRCYCLLKMDLEFCSYDEAPRHFIPPLPLLQVSGMRPLCCPEASLAAPAPHTVAASGSPAPAPCV